MYSQICLKGHLCQREKKALKMQLKLSECIIKLSRFEDIKIAFMCSSILNT